MQKSGGENSSYIVLARKWRPAQFSDIVGQGHVVRTLMNAIRSERIHQAYLFTGSRGIGKTSIARIFAKAIRCENSRFENETILSCGQCSSCKEITLGTGTDVIEIDGASNNGVEAVREIRENAKFMPSYGKKKIYIIDEVHMLTTAAFNALLKTLEEPPAHVIFMFATTEPHKIPATILSRCQRFDFRRVTQTQAQQRLVEVSKAENLTIEMGALALIARAAEGSMRDALSLLDQVIAFSGGDITVQSVRDSIGLIEGQTILGILTGIFARKPLDALELVEAAYQRGHDLRVLGRSLVEFLHAAILAKVGAPNSQTLELSEEEWKELRSIAALRELAEIELIFQVLHHGLEWIARSPQPKVVLDVLVIKCATAEALIYADSNTESAGPASPSSSANSTNSTQSNSTHASSSNAAPTHQQAAPARTTSPQTIAPQTEAISAPSPAAAIAARLGGAATSPVLKTGVVTPASAVSAAIAPTAPVTATTAIPTAATQAPAHGNDAPLNQKVAPTSVEGFVEYVRKSRPLLASILEHGSDGEIVESEQALRLFYRPEESYYHKQVQNRTSLDQILLLTKEYFGKSLRLIVELKDGGESLADRKERQYKDRQDKARQAVQTHPIIQEAKSLFGGELGPIELTDNEGGSDHV
jgi:DNA polymerase-3 subunit gamma/tau